MKSHKYKKAPKDHPWRERYPNRLEAEAEIKKAKEFIKQMTEKKEK